MQFYDAKVADIVRTSQRDHLFVEGFQNDLFTILKLFGSKNYNYLRKVVTLFSNVWYYSLTSLGNVQTLGEEYTGTLRLNDDRRIPSRTLELVWLVLFIGGESMYDRLLQQLHTKVKNSPITEESKRFLTKLILFMINKKVLFLRLHYSLFYMNGVYYNLSNRITGIKYVLLRNWLQDDSSTQSFKLLGQVSFVYLLFTLFYEFANVKKVESLKSVEEDSGSFYGNYKICSLCTEIRTDPCATQCGHVFCWKCIYESLNYQQSCPICREVINPSRIVYLQNYT